MEEIEGLTAECKDPNVDEEFLRAATGQLKKLLEEHYQEYYPDEKKRKLFVQQYLFENLPEGIATPLTLQEQGHIAEFELREEWEKKYPDEKLPQEFIDRCYKTRN